MNPITLNDPRAEDADEFIAAMRNSQGLHTPWTSAPITEVAFLDYLARYQQNNQKSYILRAASDEIVGVINLNEIIRDAFENAFLGFYAVSAHAGKGYMSQGLKLVLKKAFSELGLHRLEANIQPADLKSINLIKANGFSYEGISKFYLNINGQWHDHERWALTLEKYKGF